MKVLSYLCLFIPISTWEIEKNATISFTHKKPYLFKLEEELSRDDVSTWYRASNLPVPLKGQNPQLPNIGPITATHTLQFIRHNHPLYSSLIKKYIEEIKNPLKNSIPYILPILTYEHKEAQLTLVVYEGKHVSIKGVLYEINKTFHDYPKEFSILSVFMPIVYRLWKSQSRDIFQKFTPSSLLFTGTTPVFTRPFSVPNYIPSLHGPVGFRPLRSLSNEESDLQTAGAILYYLCTASHPYFSTTRPLSHYGLRGWEEVNNLCRSNATMEMIAELFWSDRSSSIFTEKLFARLEGNVDTLNFEFGKQGIRKSFSVASSSQSSFSGASGLTNKELGHSPAILPPFLDESFLIVDNAPVGSLPLDPQHQARLSRIQQIVTSFPPAENLLLRIIDESVRSTIKSTFSDLGEYLIFFLRNNPVRSTWLNVKKMCSTCEKQRENGEDSPNCQECFMNGDTVTFQQKRENKIMKTIDSDSASQPFDEKHPTKERMGLEDAVETLLPLHGLCQVWRTVSDIRKDTRNTEINSLSGVKGLEKNCTRANHLCEVVKGVLGRFDKNKQSRARIISKETGSVSQIDSVGDTMRHLTKLLSRMDRAFGDNVISDLIDSSAKTDPLPMPSSEQFLSRRSSQHSLERSHLSKQSAGDMRTRMEMMSPRQSVERLNQSLPVNAFNRSMQEDDDFAKLKKSMRHNPPTLADQFNKEINTSVPFQNLDLTRGEESLGGKTVTLFDNSKHASFLNAVNKNPNPAWQSLHEIQNMGFKGPEIPNPFMGLRESTSQHKKSEEKSEGSDVVPGAKVLDPAWELTEHSGPSKPETEPKGGEGDSPYLELVFTHNNEPERPLALSGNSLGNVWKTEGVDTPRNPNTSTEQEDAPTLLSNGVNAVSRKASSSFLEKDFQEGSSNPVTQEVTKGANDNSLRNSRAPIEAPKSLRNSGVPVEALKSLRNSGAPIEALKSLRNSQVAEASNQQSHNGQQDLDRYIAIDKSVHLSQTDEQLKQIPYETNSNMQSQVETKSIRQSQVETKSIRESQVVSKSIRESQVESKSIRKSQDGQESNPQLQRKPSLHNSRVEAVREKSLAQSQTGEKLSLRASGVDGKETLASSQHIHPKNNLYRVRGDEGASLHSSDCGTIRLSQTTPQHADDSLHPSNAAQVNSSNSIAKSHSLSARSLPQDVSDSQEFIVKPPSQNDINNPQYLHSIASVLQYLFETIDLDDPKPLATFQKYRENLIQLLSSNSFITAFNKSNYSLSEFSQQVRQLIPEGNEKLTEWMTRLLERKENLKGNVATLLSSLLSTDHITYVNTRPRIIEAVRYLSFVSTSLAGYEAIFSLLTVKTKWKDPSAQSLKISIEETLLAIRYEVSNSVLVLINALIFGKSADEIYNTIDNIFRALSSKFLDIIQGRSHVRKMIQYCVKVFRAEELSDTSRAISHLCQSLDTIVEEAVKKIKVWEEKNVHLVTQQSLFAGKERKSYEDRSDFLEEAIRFFRYTALVLYDKPNEVRNIDSILMYMYNYTLNNVMMKEDLTMTSGSRMNVSEVSNNLKMRNTEIEKFGLAPGACESKDANQQKTCLEYLNHLVEFVNNESEFRSLRLVPASEVTVNVPTTLDVRMPAVYEFVDDLEGADRISPAFEKVEVSCGRSSGVVNVTQAAQERASKGVGVVRSGRETTMFDVREYKTRMMVKLLNNEKWLIDSILFYYETLIANIVSSPLISKDLKDAKSQCKF